GNPNGDKFYHTGLTCANTNPARAAQTFRRVVPATALRASVCNWCNNEAILSCQSFEGCPMPANSHFCGLLLVFERSAGACAVVLPTLVSFLAIVCTMILSPTSAHAQGPSAAPIDLPPISLAPPTAANLPVDQGLRQMEDSTHRMVWALAGIVHETRRTEVDVTPNPMFVGGVGCPYPFGYDPEMLDPLESYGFDFGLDTAPTLRRDTGKPLPMRKEVVEPLVFQIDD